LRAVDLRTSNHTIQGLHGSVFKRIRPGGFRLMINPLLFPLLFPLLLLFARGSKV
jgi:hypothetical protein